MQLTITLPADLQEKLTARAVLLNVSLESLVIQYLEKTAQQSYPIKNDPLIALLGTIKSDVPDLADNHDDYLGQALHKEINGAE
jgi:hypothetical protein